MLRRRTQDLTISEMDGELIVLDIAGNQIHQLNPTASFIWEQCDSADTVEEIASRVADLFSVNATDILPDVRRTIDGLLAANLLAKS